MRTIPSLFATLAGCAIVAGLLVSACDSSGNGLATGGDGQSDTLHVSIVTSGEPPDSNGYVVKLGRAAGRQAAVNDTLVFSELTDGYYTLALGDVAPNCKVQGRNPTSVNIGRAGASVTFAVSCAPFGAILADVKTSGNLPDTAAFTLVIRGGASQPVGPNGSVLFPGLAAGDYTVLLLDRPRRCTLTPPEPGAVTVVSGDTTHVTFEVTCADPGNLQVIVRTSGAPFADGYVLVLDGAQRQPIRVNDTFLFANLDTAPHSVGLEGLPDNCLTSGANPQTVTPISGGTSPLTINVVCLRTGTLSVGIQRSGMAGSLPPTVVTISGPGGFIQTGEPGVFHLPPGRYQVALRGAGVAFFMSCQVRGPDSQTVDVRVGSIAQAVFDVFCDFE